MKQFRFVSFQGVVGLCFVLAFAFETALLTGCAVFSSPPASELSLEESEAREAGALALFSKGILVQTEEAKKGTNANPSACLDSFAKAHTLLPDNRDLLVALLAGYENVRQYTNAYRAVSGYLLRHPDDEDLRLDAAHFADAAKLYADAANECSVLLQTAPTNREISIAQVRLYFLSEQDALALAAMRREFARYQDATARNLPIEWAYYFSREAEEPARAIPCLELAMEFQKTNVSICSTLLASIGECRLALGETNAALRIWHNAYLQWPDSTTPLQLSGAAIAQDGKRFAALRHAAVKPHASDETLMLFASALQTAPTEDSGVSNTNNFFHSWQGNMEALKILRGLYVRWMCAGYFPNADFYNWSIVTLDETLTVEGRLPARQLQASSAYRALDRSLVSRQELVRLAKEAIAAFPTTALFKNFLAYYWAERGENLEEANDLANEVLELSPNNAAYIDTKGWILFKQGRPYQALQFLMKAGEREHDPEIFGHIAVVLRSLGRLSEAERFENALKKDSAK